MAESERKAEMDEQSRKAIEEFGYDIYDLEEYDYDLPEDRIAQTPAQQRDHSRLLVMDRGTGELKDKPIFANIVDYLRPGDVLVRNNTKVIPARLNGIKEGTGARVEVLLLRQLSEEGADVWECLVGNAKAVHEGAVIDFGEGKLKAVCTEVFDEGIRHFRFEYQGVFLEVLDELGRMPLPPYIQSQEAPNDRYQTVYAKVEGSAAAPTAGFHFTPELLDRIRAMGVEVLDVTLHVGLGTFRPVKTDDIREHHMHSEQYHMDEYTAAELNRAKDEGWRIIAVGTTSVRTLETVAHLNGGRFRACTGDTALFIYPGFDWMAVDCMITNFHLPKSTLVMLVSAFSTRDNVLNAYRHAVDAGYRFFSFGDAMFLADDVFKKD